MLEGISRQEVPWGLAEAVHRQTEGNPLFVQEVVRYLAEEGLIKREDGRWRSSRETPLEMTIPEGLRDVIGKRLSLLSADCNRLLSVASVIGREFALDILRGVANINEEVFVNALKEAVQMSVLEERSQLGSIRYRFTHAFFRQTMYEELIAPQRLKLHQQVARSLETQYAKRLEEHAAELAEHFSQSTDPADLAKAVSYGEMAAQRAISVYAYGEAVRLLEQALKVQRVLDPDDKAKVCDLLLALGECLGMVGQVQRVFTVELEEAFSLAEAGGDKTRAARACALALLNIFAYGAGTMVSWATPEAAQWVERADRYAVPDTPARVWANAGMGQLKATIGYWTHRSDMMKEGCQLLIRNVELARRLNDPEAFFTAVYCRIHYASAPHHTEERLKLAEELAHKSRAGISMRMQGAAASIIAQVLLESGQRTRAEEFINESKEIAERSGQVLLLWLWMFSDAALATLDGRLEDVMAMCQDMRTRAEQTGAPPGVGVVAGVASFMALLHLGRIDEISQMIKSSPVFASSSLHSMFLGQKAEALKALDQWVIARPGIGTFDDETRAFNDVISLQGAVRIGHSQAAELLLRRFAGSGLLTTGANFLTCIPRHLGAAAALLGRPDEARKYYDEAVKVTTEMKFRPELALTRLQLAELLLEHYSGEKADALEHLDFAIKEFREMKMQPSLERALKLHSQWTEK
jgi:tetratricopeptide (TPR) repeat protein